jgi:hypothetical protein
MPLPLGVVTALAAEPLDEMPAAGWRRQPE